MQVGNRPFINVARRGPVQSQDAEGRLRRAPDEEYVRDFFTYGASITFTATGQRLPLNINIQADADFVLVKQSAASSDSSPAFGGALVNVIDSGSDRKLFFTQLPLSTIFGTGQLPFILPWVHVFPRQGTLELDVTNQGTATQTLWFTFSGYKIIPVSRL